AQRFDPARGQLLGPAEKVTQPVMRAELGFYQDLFTVSDSGVLVLRPGSAKRQLTWVDRRGYPLRRIGAPAVIHSVSLAPGGREAVVSTRAVETSSYSTSIVDLDRDAWIPVAESAAMAVWAPDGRSIFYRHDGAAWEIRRRAAHGDPKDQPTG